MCAMAAARDSPAAIGAIAHQAPELLLHDGAGVPLAALWRHTAIDAVASGLPQHAVALHLGGCTLVEKWRDGRLVGHRSHIGSVSLVPAQVSTQWVLGGGSRVAHLYVEPAQIARAAEDSGRPDGIRDFFAERDEVLAALVRVALAAAAPGASDSLGLDQLRALVVRHLLQRYGIDGRPAVALAAVTLTTATLRRLYAYIDERLEGELRLAELAAVARLSEDHFLRAFKAAVGQTPHQYVLDCRIARAQDLLARGAPPMAEVARRVGFVSASHFSAAFRRRVGVAPRSWRAQR